MIWEHNENGKIASETKIYSSGYTETLTNFYNDKGLLVKSVAGCSNGSYTEIETFTYDSNDNLLHYTKTYNDTLISNYEYTYDERGYIKTKTWSDTQHLEYDYGTTEYTTDENGNIIKLVSVGANAHSGEDNIVIEMGYNDEGEKIWENYSNWGANWSKITYEGYSVFYHKYNYFYSIIPE